MLKRLNASTHLLASAGAEMDRTCRMDGVRLVFPGPTSIRPPLFGCIMSQRVHMWSVFFESSCQVAQLNYRDRHPRCGPRTSTIVATPLRLAWTLSRVYYVAPATTPSSTGYSGARYSTRCGLFFWGASLLSRILLPQSMLTPHWLRCTPLQFVGVPWLLNKRCRLISMRRLCIVTTQGA